jgi:cbb3-type cytochrome oxidase subunit 3
VVSTQSTTRYAGLIFFFFFFFCGTICLFAKAKQTNRDKIKKGSLHTNNRHRGLPFGIIFLFFSLFVVLLSCVKP